MTNYLFTLILFFFFLNDSLAQTDRSKLNFKTDLLAYKKGDIYLNNNEIVGKELETYFYKYNSSKNRYVLSETERDGVGKFFFVGILGAFYSLYTVAFEKSNNAGNAFGVSLLSFGFSGSLVLLSNRHLKRAVKHYNFEISR